MDVWMDEWINEGIELIFHKQYAFVINESIHFEAKKERKKKRVEKCQNFGIFWLFWVLLGPWEESIRM